MSEKHYLGNPLLKKANTKVGLTEEQLIELTKCSIDPVYFSKHYMKIVTLDHGLQNFNMYPFQERMITSFQNNRFNIVLCCRQAGKCLSGDTEINIRNKRTGESKKIKIGNFYEEVRDEKINNLS
jgi:hypothetical protein